MKALQSILLICLLSVAGLAQAISLTDRFQNLVDDVTGSDEILHPDQAFVLSSHIIDAKSVGLHWQIAPGYYLYQNRFAVESKSEGITVAELILPVGKEKDDPSFGLVVVNTGEAELTVPLSRDKHGAETIQLAVSYQGCKDNSVCYPPQQKLLDIALPPITVDNNAFVADGETAQLPSKARVSEQDRILQKLSEGSVIGSVLMFFIFGLLLSLTPCVFPMIPILSGIIVGQGQSLSAYRAFVLSLVYVLAMAATYAVLGVLAGSFAINLQAASQNVWVIVAFSLVFVALALSMFGLYQLQLPVVMQNRLNQWSGQQQSGSLHGAAVMGVLSAIIVGPCVAPPLAGALLYISQTGNALLGGAALFAMGLGFGVPLLLIGTSAGRLLPQAGSWMVAIKAVFGVIMLGVAIWFLQRILPGPVSLCLWAALLIVSAVYLGALNRPLSGPGWPRLWQGLGLVLLVYGILLIVAASLGGQDPLRPFHRLALHTGTAKPAAALAFKTIKSLDDVRNELQQASLQGRTVMLDFYADWCVVCKEIETYTFSDPAVQASLKDIVLLKADVTANDATDQALLQHFNLFGPPAILFFDDQATELAGYRLVGFIAADDFVRHVSEARSL